MDPETQHQDRRRQIFVMCVVLWALFPAASNGEPVNVFARFDTNRVPIGGTATLLVTAAISPEYQTQADQIFSWNIDLLNAAGAVAQINPSSLRKPASDNDPRTASPGTQNGSDLRGIADTFMNSPAAGRDNEILLFSISVKGLAAGKASFRIAPGTTTSFSEDFLVAPKNGTNPLIGANYTAALAELEVVSEASGTGPRLQIQFGKLADGRNRVNLSFTPPSSQNYFVQTRDSIESGLWQTLPGGPHNSGTVTDTNSAPRRFYRIQVAP